MQKKKKNSENFNTEVLKEFLNPLGVFKVKSILITVKYYLPSFTPLVFALTVQSNAG